MNGRRGFLAFVGSVPLVGPVISAFGYSEPTLMLPPAPRLVRTPAIPNPVRTPFLAAHESQMMALLHMREVMPGELFFDWMEGGLRIAESCKAGGQVSRAMEADRAAGRDPWGVS